MGLLTCLLRRDRTDRTSGIQLEDATALLRAGAIAEAQRDNERAEQAYHQALELIRGVRGDQHPDTARALGRLGKLYQPLGRYAQAEPLLRQALEVWRSSLGVL